MAQVTLQGNPFHTSGELPTVGAAAPDFQLVKTDLGVATLKDFTGKRVVLNIFPSLDTPTCASSVRTFNKRASETPNTVVLCISADLPFAAARFCTTEGLANVIPASNFRAPEFGQAYGLTIVDGPLKGLLARAVVVLDEKGAVAYTELVTEIAEEPNYNAALTVLK